MKDDKCDDNILSGSGKDFFKEYKDYSASERNVLRKLYENGGADAQHGVWYILSHSVHVVVSTGWQSGFGSRSGWFDEVTNTITLNYDYLSNFNQNRDLSDLTPWAYSIIIHEALHLEQGPALSHSVEGERLAWQAGLRVYKNLSSSSASEFAPGALLQNILEDTTPQEFIDDITWDPIYKYSMRIFYPMYPEDSLFPNCGNGGYCPPLAGR